MCGGLTYVAIDPMGNTKTKKVFFPIPHAQLPIIHLDGTTAWAQWGKRKDEQPDLDVPQTGWARLSSLAEGKWNEYNPTRVIIPASQWMEKDEEKTSHWFEMEPDKGLLGILIQRPEQDVVYVATQLAEPWFAPIHPRMPMYTSRPESEPIRLRDNSPQIRLPI